MDGKCVTTKNTQSSKVLEQYQMQMFSVPPPAIPPQHAYSSMKQCPSVPLLMLRAPTPVWLYGYPRTYEQMRCSPVNAVSFPNNHDSVVGQSPSVVSSFEFRLSSFINHNMSNVTCPVLEAETVSSNEPSPSCSETKGLTAPAILLEQFPELVKTALDGCKKAEALATCHQKRPCFKKIDSLCARLKQDLVKADNVMSNINSQGVAWAVKDFIFVFTRIMNAWIIIKGYVPSKAEGLMTIHRELCPNFLVAFGHWHEATHELVQSLIKSFINLNKLAKQQRNGVNIFTQAEEQPSSSADGASPGQTSPDLLGGIGEMEPLSVNNGAYIRAGVYPNVTCPPPGFQEKRQEFLYVPLAERTQATEPVVAVSPIISKYPAVENDSSSTSSIQTFRCSPDPNVRPFMGNFLRKTSEECIKWVIDEVRVIEEGQYFYCINFAKNYFPDFDLIGSDMIELRQVYKKYKAGQYSMVVELLDDLQQIVDTCMRYVEVSTQFELWNPKNPLPDNYTEKQRIEWENFPKMQNFIAKMEHLLSDIQKRSTMTDRGTNCQSQNHCLENDLGTQRNY